MSDYHLVIIHYRITLTSALHIGTGYGLANLLDERTTRGPHALAPTSTRMPYIPGASLKGRLRMHAEQLVRALQLKDGPALCIDLFGTEQQPGRLFFGDAHLLRDDRLAIDAGVEDADGRAIPGALLPYLALEERARAALSPQRRTALEDQLVRFEAASAGLTLRGTARGWLPESRAHAALALVWLASRALTHIGGQKGRGLGAVTVTMDATIDGQTASLEQLAKELE